MAATVSVPHYGPSVPPAQVPPQIHNVTAGGMPGWQITLIAAGAAVLAALLAVTADRVRAARRHTDRPEPVKQPSRSGPERKETTMTIKQPASNTAPPPAGAPARAGTPRRRLIILASVVLAVLAGVAAAVTALIPGPRQQHGTTRPLTGTGTGTMTLNLTNGAATARFTGHLSPLGAETGYDDNTVTLTGPSTFTYTGTRIFVAASGDKLFSAITGTGTFTRTAAHSTEADTITGGTGRLRRGQRDLHGHDQLRGRLGHRDQSDQPLHRRRPRTAPLLGQIGPGGLSRPSLISSRQ